jgi:nucleoside 2-deoxyribosyltransferase
VTGPDYAARAAAGARFLDERRPGWAGRIDMDRLALIDDCDCILGQLDGTYDRGLAELGLTLRDESLLGFISDNISAWSWDQLDAAWTAEIGKRREAAQVAA